MEAEQPLLQQAQEGPIPLLDGRGAGPVKIPEVATGQQGLQGRIKLHWLGCRPTGGRPNQGQGQ